MAAKAGKKGKKKGTTMALTDFLSDEQGNVQGPGSSYVLANKSVDWAAEMEELDVYSESAYGTQQAVDRTRLPTAPKASRGPEDMEKVPMEPPFTAFIGNLPYEVSEEKIEDFFKQLQVVNVRLPEENGRFRGFGYVQFETRQALIDALGMNEEILGGRKVRIDLAGQSQHGGNERDGRSGGSRNDDGQPDRTDGDWRRSAPEPSGGSGYDDRGPSRGGFEDRGSSRGFDDRGPSRGFEDRGSSRGFDDRGPSRGFDDRGPSRGFDDRGGDRSFGRRDDRGGGGFGRDRYDDRDGGRRGFGSGFRRDDDRSGGGFDRDRGYGGDRGGDRGFGGDRGGDRGFGGDRGGDRGYRGDRGGDRGFGGDRGGDRSFGGDRGGDRGYGGDRGGDRGYGGDRGGDRGFGGDRDRGFRGDRQDRGFERQDRQDTRESEPPKERPRLQLAPRSKPLENTTASEEKSSDKPAAKASIFGNAKPVNTAQRELEIEERLRKQKLDPPAPTKSSVESRYGSSRGGYEDPRGYEEHRDSGRERRYEENTDSRHAGRSDPGSRRRSDSDKSSQDGDSQRERHSSSSSSKGRKGPSRPRKHSGDPVHQSEVTSGGEDHHREDKSYNAVSPAYRDDAHKLVPAPPPKENIWEKRKSTQTVSSPPKSDEPKSPSAQERSQNDTQSYSQSARSPQNSETQNQSSKIPPVQQQTRTTSEETSPSQSKTDRPKDFVPAEPPKENPWLKRKQERDQNTAPGTENHTGPSPAHNTGMPSAWGGRGGGGGERERGRGGRGAYGRGRGNAKPKQEKREKPMPQSLEEMPKYEEKSKKDFSDSNKFAGLIDEDEGGFDEES